MGKDDKNSISDILKKTLSLGVGTALVTEDMLKGLLQNLKDSKQDITNSVKQELKDLVSQISLTEEIEKILENYTFEIDAKINLVKKNDDAKKSTEKKSRKNQKSSKK